MNTKQFIKELIRIFADHSGCGIQYKECPCNTCFHSIEADFKHIAWLIILGLRGDYNDSRDALLEDIKKELIEGDKNESK